ncbi:MAG: GNAT family N-acetyltransferase [Proteobacteria bacterium]|nr:GNAT family N-acetyltransferase [Pseudomonadota bacterium]
MIVENNLKLKKLEFNDISRIVEGFAQSNWVLKPENTFIQYLEEQNESERLIWVAYWDNQFAGYITLKWQSLYPPFKQQQIPEIMDLNVLPFFRNKGIGSLLIKKAEKEAFKLHDTVGIGVGLYKDYGQAQKIYITEGYQPDGLGITYNYQPIEPGQMVCLDDDLILWFTKRKKQQETRTIRSIKNMPHFKWGDNCDGWWLTKDSNYAVISENMSPNTSEKRHYHRKTEQFFYCLAGELLIEIEGQNYHLSKDDSLLIYPEEQHTVKNTSTEPVQFLVISVPNLEKDRVDME